MALTVGIAGAGIGGLAAGIFLSRAGHHVDVFDKAPAPSAVGSGLILQPVGLAVLDRIDPESRARELGQRIDRLFGRVMPSGRTVLDVGYAKSGTNSHGVAVHRATLFDLLFTAAQKAGAGISYGTEVTALENASRGKFLLDRKGRRHGPFDIVINALGARSVLLQPIGRDLAYGALWANLAWPEAGAFDSHTLEQRYHRASRMAGILPIGQLPDRGGKLAAFFWSLRQDRFDQWRRQPLDQWKEEVRGLWPQAAGLLEQIDHHDQLIMARYRHGTAPRAVEGRLVHLGDACHAASPQLGQGANMALLDAATLSAALTRQSNTDAALDEYARMRALHVRLYQLISLIFTPFYQSDSHLLAGLRDHLLSPVSRFAPMQWLLSAMVAGELGAPLYRADLRLGPGEGRGQQIAFQLPR